MRTGTERHRRPPAHRGAAGARGAVLLEVLVALAILSIAGAAVVGFAEETGRALIDARRAERELRRTSAFLDAVTLWSRDDLDRHLGDRREGPWRMRVGRPTPTVYTILLMDSSGTRELLRTALFRPEPMDSAAREVDDAVR